MSQLTLPTGQLGRILLSGEHHDVAIQPPLAGKGPAVYYWADKGLVHWEREGDNTYGAISWHDAQQRVLSLVEMIQNSSHQNYDPGPMNRLKRFIEDMVRVIKKAKHQGGPWDKGAAAEHQRRRPHTMLVGSDVGDLAD